MAHILARSTAGAGPRRGAVAITVALSLVVLMGFAGIALDLARLYINKSELQTAADACALAAASQLRCPSGSSGCLTNALYAGQFAGLKNNSDFQANPVTIANGDVQASTSFTSGYVAILNAPANSTYARCIARSAGITPWFMKAMNVVPGFNIGNQFVSAQAVATLLPSGSGGFCPTAPIAVCGPAGGGSYSVGDWVGANLNGQGNGNADGAVGALKGNYDAGAIKGTFQWTAFPPPGGGSTTSIRDELAGTTTACGVSSASTVLLDNGNHQGAKDAYNTRFGIYPNGNTYTTATAPPDRTGFSYPTKTGIWPTTKPLNGTPQRAYSDYRARQATGAPYQDTNGSTGYDPQGQGNPGVQTNGTVTTSSQNLAAGTDRRLLGVPIVSNCTPGSTVAITSFGCFLMLDPMSNGQNGDNFLEFVGLATDPGSPCSQPGSPGGGGGTGALVPTLVQ